MAAQTLGLVLNLNAWPRTLCVRGAASASVLTHAACPIYAAGYESRALRVVTQR
jgi:hypothetical protein